MSPFGFPPAFTLGKPYPPSTASCPTQKQRNTRRLTLYRAAPYPVIYNELSLLLISFFLVNECTESILTPLHNRRSSFVYPLNCVFFFIYLLESLGLATHRVVNFFFKLYKKFIFCELLYPTKNS